MKKLWGLAIFLIIAGGTIHLKPAVKARTGVTTEHRTRFALADLDSWRLSSMQEINSGWGINRDGLVQEEGQKKVVCPPGATVSGDLGYGGTECHGCMISGKHVSGEPDIEFDSEPIISDIRRGGPADGKLKERDALVAIDGQPITSRAAAIQLSWLEPGKPVRLTVRRDGSLTDVEITPAARCRPLTVEPGRVIIIRKSV